MKSNEAETSGLTRVLGAFIADSSLEPPQDARPLVRRAFADTVAVAIAGQSTLAGEQILRYVAEQEARANAGVLGSRLRTTAELAALATGTLAHALDFDDTNF